MCLTCEHVHLTNIRMGARHVQAFNVHEADRFIHPHAMHWVLCNETYLQRRSQIDGWTLVQEIDNAVIYEKDLFTIIAFRGTVGVSDIKSDIQLSVSGSCSFDKIKPGIEFVSQYLLKTQNFVQLTGHSLGGAIARCVGADLGLGVITFNPAAPPSNPPSIGPNQVHYHIVFDIISAWIPSVRIDKGFRPHSTGISKYLTKIPIIKKYLFNVGIKPILNAHSLEAFTNQRSGHLSTSQMENTLWQNWFNQLPSLFKTSFLFFIQTNKLPPIP